MRSEIIQVVTCDNYDGYFLGKLFHYFKDYLMTKTDPRVKVV